MPLQPVPLDRDAPTERIEGRDPDRGTATGRGRHSVLPASDPGDARRPPPHTAIRPTTTIVSGFAPILPPDLPADVADFLAMYAAGEDFYRWVAPKFGMAFEEGDDDARERVKSTWGWIVYDEPSDLPAWRGPYDAYRWSCPTVTNWLERVKRDNYREAARECQRFESRMMIDGVAGELMDRYPDMPILTVHDAILAHEENLDLVREVVRRVWLSEAGVEPRIKIKLRA